MDRTTLIGIVLSMVAVGVGMVLKGVEIIALFNPAALLVIFVGTAAAVLISFPASTIKTIPSLLRIIFMNEKNIEVEDLIETFTQLAEKTRREGLLSLEQEIKTMDNPFLVSGLQLAVDGQTNEFIREVMLEKIDAMESRHEKGIAVFTQAGTYAPTLGVLGAVIGLIAALQDLDDTAALGAAISAAFIATLFGIFSGYVLWHPFASKLREKSKKEVQIKEIMVEGILSITNGESPSALEEKLNSYLTEKEIEAKKGDDDAA